MSTIKRDIALGLDMETGDPLKVLIVDDSKSVRMLLRQTILSMGFEIIAEAENGGQAIELFEEHKNKINLIFMDVEMPIKTGPEAVAAIRQTGSKTPIIMQTTRSEPELIKELLALGISGYILKPFNRQDMFIQIAKVLGRHDRLEKF